MKRLILVRHAKSSWEFDVIDHARPLKQRGINDAHLVASAFKLLNITFDYVISSDATRALSTANIFREILSINDTIFKLDHNLYDFSGELLTKTIKYCSNAIESILVFGHNHALTAFVNAYGTKYIDNVPTSGLTILEFEIDNWSDLKKGTTIKTIFPRDLK